MSPSGPSASSTSLPESEWPTPPSCPGSPLCEPSSAASAPTTSLTASSLAPGNAPNTCDYVFHTTKGDVTVRAFRSLSPAGADRLHTLVRHGFYDGSPLYRILPGFVAQWGVAAEPSLATVFDWRNDVPGSILPDEQPNPDGPGNDKLWVSYSSSYDTATNPPTATNRTAELFLNLVDNKAKLDGKNFVPFAKVVKGMEVVDTWYAGYGEMDGACGLHLDGGWVCHGPNETDLYAGGAAFVAQKFPSFDRIGYVTANPNPRDPDPSWYYGNTKHHFSWSDGGEGHGVLWYLVFAAVAVMFIGLIKRQKNVTSAAARKERRGS